MVNLVDNNSVNSVQRIRDLALASVNANRKVVEALINGSGSPPAPIRLNSSKSTSTDLAFAAPRPKDPPPPRGSIVDTIA